MKQLLTILIVTACAMMFVFTPPMLELVGWQYVSSGASAVTKIHPAFYLLLAATGLAIFSANPGTLATLKRPSVLFFALATLFLILRGAQIASGGVTGGEFSIAVVTYGVTLLTVLCLPALDGQIYDRMALAVRLFFAFCSLMALGEQAIGHRLIPSFLDGFGGENRSAALWGHPLAGAMFTGLFIVYLVTSGRRNTPLPLRFGEILLHTVAMFAFGGRSALVFTAMTLVISGLLARPGSRGGAAQRILPIVILAVGFGLVFVPIPVIDVLLDRFTNDQGSAETRASAIKMLGMLSSNELMFGITGPRRLILQEFFHTEAGIELSWVALTLSYGLLATIPMALALPTLLFATARKLDRSAFYMALQFLVVTAGSQGLGGKGTLIAQVIMMMVVLGRTPAVKRLPQVTPAPTPAAATPAPLNVPLQDQDRAQKPRDSMFDLDKFD